MITTRLCFVDNCGRVSSNQRSTVVKGHIVSLHELHVSNSEVIQGH